MACKTSLKPLVCLFAVFTLATAAERYRATEPHMGSMVAITLYAENSDQAQQAFVAGFRRIAELDRTLSDYNPNSELSRACLQQSKASPDLLAVVTEAQKMAQLSDGAFDITVGPLSTVWRNARKLKEFPSQPSIADARRRTGYRNLEVTDGTIRCATPDMLLDAGGIAKGYAADAALEAIRRAGVSSALVAVSGDIAIGAAPPGRRGWRVRVLEQTRVLADSAVSTSGDEFQFITLNGKKYSHVVDPRTGIALTNSPTVAVIAKKAIDCDALATAVSVGGNKLVEKLAALYQAEIIVKPN